MEHDEVGGRRNDAAERRERWERQRERFASDLEHDLRFVRSPAQQVDDLLAKLGLANDEA